MKEKNLSMNHHITLIMYNQSQSYDGVKVIGIQEKNVIQILIFFSGKQCAVQYSFMMLGSNSKLQLPVSLTITRVNNQ